MFYPINGWTKARIIQTLQERMGAKKAKDHNGRCAYLTSEGTRCAVGAFIPDGHPGQSYQGMVCESSSFDDSEDTLLSTYPDLQLIVPLKDEALYTLQGMHDDVRDSADARPACIEWVQMNVAEDER